MNIIIIALRRLLAAVALVALLPVNLIIAALLRIMQGKNVLFRQTRSGLGSKPFTLVKFRTMRDLRDANGELLPDEDRVTGIGTFLRKTRLDELPSLWNVMNGDIAIVGPRPLLPKTIASLGERGVKRGSVPPGLTGWAQVNGNTLLSLDEKIALDLWYIDNGHWRTDLSILISTLGVMAAGEKRRRLQS
jgi:lipopolysaccharide/colanic/teichoic acid biosynthesis glycosyltransferase